MREAVKSLWPRWQVPQRGKYIEYFCSFFLLSTKTMPYCNLNWNLTQKEENKKSMPHFCCSEALGSQQQYRSKTCQMRRCKRHILLRCWLLYLEVSKFPLHNTRVINTLLFLFSGKQHGNIAWTVRNASYDFVKYWWCSRAIRAIRAIRAVVWRLKKLHYFFVVCCKNRKVALYYIK